MITTTNLTGLPAPILLQQICKSIAALEAIISPEWSDRYYSYQKNWSPTEEISIMRGGSGDEMFILFQKNGVCINGFAHESNMNGWQKEEQKIYPGILDNLPNAFKEFIYGEPIGSIGTTFCIWQTTTDKSWQTGTITFPTDNYKDGSSDLLQLLDGNPITYKNWAEDYYEIDIPLLAVQQIFETNIVTPALVVAINPALTDYQQLQSDLDEIGISYTSFS
jgi:hypothetical protein